MSEGIDIQRTPEGCIVFVRGRANFSYAVPLREFAGGVAAEDKHIRIDLAECVGMDSTFMGVLSMIGLKARKLKIGVTVSNAPELCRSLLKGLGVEKLFTFETVDTAGNGHASPLAQASWNQMATAETVLEAHKTLMEVDEGNVSKFGKVVEMVDKDLERLRKGQN